MRSKPSFSGYTIRLMRHGDRMRTDSMFVKRNSLTNVTYGITTINVYGCVGVVHVLCSTHMVSNAGLACCGAASTDTEACHGLVQYTVLHDMPRQGCWRLHCCLHTCSRRCHCSFCRRHRVLAASPMAALLRCRGCLPLLTSVPAQAF